MNKLNKYGFAMFFVIICSALLHIAVFIGAMSFLFVSLYCALMLVAAYYIKKED